MKPDLYSAKPSMAPKRFRGTALPAGILPKAKMDMGAGVKKKSAVGASIVRKLRSGKMAMPSTERVNKFK